MQHRIKSSCVSDISANWPMGIEHLHHMYLLSLITNAEGVFSVTCTSCRVDWSCPLGGPANKCLVITIARGKETHMLVDRTSSH
jgi:hypothetical protein